MDEIMILIHHCNLFLQHNIGTRLLKNCNKRSKANFQGTKQCAKNKRNFLNFDYKKIVNYHKGIKNHTCFWDLLFEEKEMYHLPCQFNKEIYESIESFQGNKSVIIPLHTKDINVEGDRIHGLALAKETQNENDKFQLQDNTNDFQN